MSLLNIDWLKEKHQSIHYFGLGFIQIKLDDISRMHFYHDEVASIIHDEEIHNHRYAFISTVLKGFLTQTLYQVVGGSSHKIEYESCSEGVAAPTESKLCSVKKIFEGNFTPASFYHIQPDTFHKISAQSGTITYLARQKKSKEFAQVIRKKGAPKVCPFSVKKNSDELWQIVREMINV